MAIPDVDLLHAAFAGNVDFEEDLAVMRRAGGFLILDLIQVPVSEKDVRIARNEEEFLRAVRFG